MQDILRDKKLTCDWKTSLSHLRSNHGDEWLSELLSEVLAELWQVDEAITVLVGLLEVSEGGPAVLVLHPLVEWRSRGHVVVEGLELGLVELAVTVGISRLEEGLDSLLQHVSNWLDCLHHHWLDHRGEDLLNLVLLNLAVLVHVKLGEQGHGLLPVVFCDLTQLGGLGGKDLIEGDGTVLVGVHLFEHLVDLGLNKLHHKTHHHLSCLLVCHIDMSLQI